MGLYERCKAGAEACAARAIAAGLPVVILRLGQVYGPRAVGGTLELVRRVLAGWPTLVAGGRGLAHPVFIDHVVDAVVAACTRDGVAAGAFNVADADVTWREFAGFYARMAGRSLRSVPAAGAAAAAWGAEQVARLARRPPRVHRLTVNYLLRQTRCSTDRARTLLGWAPRQSMEEAMARTEHWLRSSGHLPR